MADKALENAMNRHNEIASEIASLGRRVAELKSEQERIIKFIEAWHEFAQAGEPNADGPPEAPPPPESEDEYERPTRRKKVTGNPLKEVVVAKARELIMHRGEPISRNSLFDDLEAKGIHIQGTDPKMVLSTMLWRMKDQIVRLKMPDGSMGYWLPEKPYEPASYVPPSEREMGVDADDALLE